MKENVQTTAAPSTEAAEQQDSYPTAQLASMHGDTSVSVCMLFDELGNGLMPKGEITAIKSEAKSGKTWLCQLMAAAMLGTVFGLSSFTA